MANKVRFGIVGVSSIGRVHAENLATNIPNAELVAIADSNFGAAKNLGAQLGVKNVYPDFQQLLENKDVDAVVISVPTYLKKDMVVAVAESGRHIFCEKPMAASLREADEMIGARRRAGVKFQIGFMRRFDRSHVRAKQLIDEGKIGKITLITSHARDPGAVAGWGADPQLSGGIFADNCSHDFDAIRWLTGQEIKRIFAEGAALVFDEAKKTGTFDTANAVMRLDSGAIAQIDTGFSMYAYDVRMEVLGTEGGIMMSMGNQTNTTLLGKAVISNESYSSYQSRFAEAYRDELVDFVECILTGREPKVTETDGRIAAELALAASESAQKLTPIFLFSNR
jgi:myo-inositol 2-dehydrogenase/D-chiro-inositol 1-dehydrogenase